MSAAALPRRLGWSGLLLAAVPIGMAAVGFLVFPPLYSLWCELTGTGMSPDNAGAGRGAMSGVPAVELVFTQRADGLPVRFHAERRMVMAVPGEPVENVFHFTNLSDRTVRFRPVHSVSPPRAAEALRLEICFCFQEQTVGPHETRDFPVRLYLGNGIDPRVGTALLSYTLMPVGDGDGR